MNSRQNQAPTTPANPFQGRMFRIHNKITNDSLGPFSWEELTSLARSGDLNLESRIADVARPDQWLKIADTPLVFELPLSVEDHRYVPIEKKGYKPSHRTRDYLILLVLGNFLIFLMNFGIALNVISVMFLLALVVIFNVALAWIMFGIFQRY